ncbi:MAG: hypothetical protein Q4F27_07065 [Desulfovibrionaceae bacterium]|nr:hypothetical protein [Desulfovibrionaceae bacterium]
MVRIFSAFFFKEFVKTGVCMAVLTLSSAAFMTWQWLNVRRLFMLDHPEIVWYRVMDLGQVPYAALAFLPIACAFVFCCCQFLPEMRDERLRISLHLPCGMVVLVLAHLLFGLCFLSLLFLGDALLLMLILGTCFPEEAVSTALLTSLPWFLAGLIAYLCVAYAILEPQRRAKLMGLLLGLGLCVPLLGKAAPGSLVPALPCFALILPLLIIGVFLPALNFRHRRVQ